jgi:hypothetical protein
MRSEEAREFYEEDEDPAAGGTAAGYIRDDLFCTPSRYC